jgi:Phage integrase family
LDSQASHDAAPTIVNSTVARTREYLTGAEVDALMAAARKSSRWGHRDATMILIAYRHGLRASEVCDLQWHRVELQTDPMSDVTSAVRLRSTPFKVTSCGRCAACSVNSRQALTCSFPSEARRWRPRASMPSSSASASGPAWLSPSIHTCCGTAAALRLPMRGMTRGHYRRGSATGTSSIRCATRSWRPIGSGISGEIESSRPRGCGHRRGARHRWGERL